MASALYVTSKTQVRLVRAELKIDFFSFIIRRYFFAIHVELKAKIVSPSHAGVNPVTWWYLGLDLTVKKKTLLLSWVSLCDFLKQNKVKRAICSVKYPLTICPSVHAVEAFTVLKVVRSNEDSLSRREELNLELENCEYCVRAEDSVNIIAVRCSFPVNDT